MKVNEKLLGMLLVVTVLNITTAKAQLLSDISIGANGGVYIYQGDLAPSDIGSLKTPTAGFNMYAQKALSDYISVRLNLGIASLRGDESRYSSPAYRQQRNFKFSTPLKEISGLMLWNIKGSNYYNNGIAPYLFTGLTLSFLHTQTDYSRVDTTLYKYGILQDIAKDVAHGTPKVIPVIPLGAGVEFPLTQKLLLTTEAAYHFSFTDYIDGFSVAADPSMKDHYYSVTVGVRYKFGSSDEGGKGKKLGCPANIY